MLSAGDSVSNTNEEPSLPYSNKETQLMSQQTHMYVKNKVGKCRTWTECLGKISEGLTWAEICRFTASQPLQTRKQRKNRKIAWCHLRNRTEASTKRIRFCSSFEEIK